METKELMEAIKALLKHYTKTTDIAISEIKVYLEVLNNSDGTKKIDYQLELKMYL